MFLKLFFSFLIIIPKIKTEIEARIRLTSNNEFIIETQDFSESKLYIARAYYNNTLNETGWDTLSITTNKIFSDEIQMKSIGKIEAFVTKDRIFNHYKNVMSFDNLEEKPLNFLIEQENYINEQYKKNPSDIYFYLAHLILVQFNSLYEEYNLICEEDKKINKEGFYLMQYQADLIEIKEKFNPPNYSKMTIEEFQNYILNKSHCSALFKVKEDLSDIYFGHNTWHCYSMMNRIFKEYNINLNHPLIKSKNVLFSSYPATLNSLDDFYITNQELIVIETTNIFFNNTLYKYINPNSLLCWQRVIIANFLSETSLEWTQHFSKYSSGTYNDMFMILDGKKIDLDKKIISDNSFYIIETLPNYTFVNDVTDYLKRSYFPSYNVPFDKENYKISNISNYIKEKPFIRNRLDYNFCSRAKIFRRDQYKIKDIETMKKMMRYNNYTKDEFSLNQPSFSISSRADLSKTSSCSGAYDAKLSSIKNIKGKKNKKIFIISGPTYNDDIKPFNWNNTENNMCRMIKREGLKDEMKFEWVEYVNKFD